jgi:Uri superfamily endonuclease
VIALERDQWITIGKLGPLQFEAGTYGYCGSAMAGFRGRVGRHFSKDKKLRWHIDYLLKMAQPVGAYLVPGGKEMECALGSFLSELPGSKPVKGFGSSDCSCSSHLFLIDEASIPELLEKLGYLIS